MIRYADPFSLTGHTFESLERVAAIARLTGRTLGAVIVVDDVRQTARLLDVTETGAA